jgi:peptidoglycan-associated lipoprotein
VRGKKSTVLIMGALLLGAMSLEGCATKKYVNQQVGVVDTKVAEHETHLGTLDKNTREALERAEAAGKLAEGKFVYSLVLTDEDVKFPVNKSELSPEAQARLQQFAEKLKADNKNVYIEVQGHTDSTGTPEGNMRLGAARAEAVRLFLNKQGVALNRLSTISYGADVPVAPNNTRVGRATNRRVVIIVLA